MNKVFLKILGILLKLINLLINLLKKVASYLNVIRNYLNKNECAKFSDCVLLQKLITSQPPSSDRFIEYPWLMENIDIKKGRLLDIGSTIGDLLHGSLPAEVEVNCLNLNTKNFKSKKIIFKNGDIRNTDYPNNYFDIVSCISTLEHIGVAGRYGSDHDPDGDKKAMREIERILKPNGKLLVSVPYGRKDVLPINKLYNLSRINDLFSDLEIVSQEFRKFNKDWYVWLKVSEMEAATTDMILDGWYALCLIKARKK